MKETVNNQTPNNEINPRIFCKSTRDFPQTLALEASQVVSNYNAAFTQPHFTATVKSARFQIVCSKAQNSITKEICMFEPHLNWSINTKYTAKKFFPDLLLSIYLALSVEIKLNSLLSIR